MITRIAAYLIAAALILGVGWYLFDSYTSALKENALLHQANDQLAETVGALDSQRESMEQDAAQYVSRIRTQEEEAKQRNHELQELREQDNEADNYLGLTIPDAAAGWLWLRADCKDQSRCDYASLLSAGGYASSSTTTAQTINWCADVRAALDSCNADKSMARQQIEEQRKRFAGPRGE